MKTVAEFTNDMIAQLRAADPSASAEVGTPERKIIEAVATILAESQVDFEALSVQHDIDQMAGGALDSFLGTIFRFGRQSATASQGTVRFSRTTPATQPIIIPKGTQLVASLENSDLPPVPFTTTELGVIAVGDSFVDVPVQAGILGTVGNVDSGTITALSGLRSINGITSITNAEPTRGGVDAEDDEDYRARFKNTFFRNVAGTHDQYLALAVSQTGVSKANVIGPVSRYVEHVQVPTDNDDIQKTSSGGYDDNGTTYRSKRTTEVSTIPYSKHVYSTNAYLTDTTLDPATATFFRQYIDWVFNDDPQSGSIGSAWSNPSTYAVGDIVSETGTPADLHIVTVAGSTTATEPTWATVVGDTVTQDGITYMYIGTTADYNSISGLYPFQPNITVLGRQIATTAWTASTAYVLGDMVTNTQNDRIFRCTLAGTSNDTEGEPTFTDSDNATVVEADAVEWEDITWEASTAYSLGDVVYPITENGRTYICIAAGTSHSSEPTWPTTDGGEVTETGGVKWQDTTSMPLGLTADDVVLLEHQYMSASSRNIANDVENCVDIFVNGSNPRYVDSVEVIPPTTQIFQSGDSTLWTYDSSGDHYRRIVDHVAVGTGNLIMPVYWQPMIDVPESITISNNTYYKANYWDSDTSTYYNQQDSDGVYSVPAHYIAYEELGSLYGTLRARNGIEWFLSGNNYIVGTVSTGDAKKIDEFVGTQFTLSDYVFDQNISDLQTIVERNKQVTTDPLVHKEMPRFFKANVTVQYNQGANQSVTDVAIRTALRAFFNSQYFGPAIQMSDILAAIHGVPGVDNVRWTNDVDSGVNKIDEVNKTGTTVLASFNADFFMQDDELPYAPTLDANVAAIVRRAGNTWGD